MNTFDRIYQIVTKIPKGKVSTYKAIAKLSSTNPKIVGYALHANKNASQVPCHRVINAKGVISSGYAFGGPDTQKKILIKEGIIFDKNGVIDLKKYGYFMA